VDGTLPTFTPVSLETLPGWAGALLAEARVARLGYVDEDEHPRVLPVTFAIAAGAVWSAIDEKPKRSAEPARLRHLRRRPEAALLVDLYDDDWTRLAWVQLLGTVEVLPVDSSPEAMEVLARKYAPYAVRTPPGPLLRLTVDRTRQWRSAGSPRPDHSLHEPG
jgi:PPOX class probable F420-dependent enzyme